MAKLANLNNGNAPTTMARRFGHLLLRVHCHENVPGDVFDPSPKQGNVLQSEELQREMIG